MESNVSERLEGKPTTSKLWGKLLVKSPIKCGLAFTAVAKYWIWAELLHKEETALRSLA